MTRLLQALLYSIAAISVQAQVVVNEFSAANLNQFQDNYQKYEDWIELYNLSGSTVNIGGYYLSDNQNNPTKWMIPAGTTIAAGGYRVFWCDGRDEVSDGQYHTNFKLKQYNGSEEVVLADANGNIVDNIQLTPTQLGHSHARNANGTGNWIIDITPTPGSTNGSNGHYAGGYAPKPEVNITGGFFSGSVGVQLVNAPIGATVRYTLDGTLPVSTSPIFPGALVVSSTKVLKLRSFSTDAQVLPSYVEFNTYFINEQFSLPVFSVAADEVQDLANGNQGLRPQGSVEYFNVLGDRTATSYGELNSHGQDSWVNFQRSLDWISRDEMGYSDAVHDTLFRYSDRDEFQRFIFRASGDDNYPADNVPPDPNNVHDGGCHIRDEYVHTLAKNGGMKLDVRSVERCILFLNGEYWGVYAIRERPDEHDYTDYYYDQDKYSLQFLKTWGYHWAEYGDQQAFDDWAVLRDFILNNDMGNAANYDFVEGQYNYRSIIDYMTTNLNVVASDWLNYNMGWWRGIDPNGDHKKWAYILWDNDATFDYYINYSGVPNTNTDAQPCDIEGIADFLANWGWWDGEDQGKHEQIFLKLLEESSTFEQLYYSRYADHMNTIFSCENMLATFDSMVATIVPEMPRHIQRWGGSMGEWNGNIQEMRDFIEERCGVLGAGMVDCYELEGPYDLTIRTEPANVGHVKLNTLWHEQLPWTGQYFGNMDNLVEAQTIPGGPTATFSHWESTSGYPILPHPDSIQASVAISGPDTIIAVFTVDYSTVEDPMSQVLFNAYPVPASDNVNVNIQLPAAEQFTISVYDLQGKRVYSEQFEQQSLTLRIPTDELSRGIYMLSFESERGKRQRKIPLID